MFNPSNIVSLDLVPYVREHSENTKSKSKEKGVVLHKRTYNYKYVVISLLCI